MGKPSLVFLTSASNLSDAGISYSIDFMKVLSVEYSALNGICTVDSYEELEGANPPTAELNASTRYEEPVRIIELSNMRTIHIVLSPPLVNVPDLQTKRSSHLHKLYVEMRARRVGASGFLVLVNPLKTNTSLIAIDLGTARLGVKELLHCQRYPKPAQLWPNLDILNVLDIRNTPDNIKANQNAKTLHSS
ncbi:hypothetical protein BCR41DRAFT_392122 [Lobosporangium transversale]|uniref:Uncharacterized protein n=1 Tax=Lobosporangium transversale TaxID=64571 RepID=A0A1Y2H1T1_9FUNG|nr:hypothetical protein BCR41DRAFT_392122 [Lobosporangium transversale]ORZ27663.1 hypothetical protein BCR41DRAFT_392122 [Lobosporangium transversale]|eukprot:XP_021885366.1 hypothetical protein BCR41DRAFT_392122 [Lobosporangium transversale]